MSPTKPPHIRRAGDLLLHCARVLFGFFSSLLNGEGGGRVLPNNSGLTPCLVGNVGHPQMESYSFMEGDAEDEGGVMGAAERWVEGPLKDLEDRALVGLVVDGRQDAYKVLVERYQGKIFSVAYGLLRNREDAREVTQEAFIKAYRNLSGFRRDSSFYTWIYRITVNLGIDFRRKAYRNREVELDETRIVPEDAHHTGPRPMPTPGASLERRQLGGRIRAAIDELPEDQRTAIVLREIQGLSYKEIADAMDCAEGTVMSRLFYARKKLQELLEDLS